MDPHGNIRNPVADQVLLGAKDRKILSTEFTPDLETIAPESHNSLYLNVFKKLARLLQLRYQAKKAAKSASPESK
jgi:hypothetical protein